MNKLLDRFQAAFYPWQNLSLDETVVGWKGRFKYHPFNATKPKKFHIKMFGLCDSTTGYTYNLLRYFGSETAYNPTLDPESESAIKVFQTLLAPLSRGHHVFADRYYKTRNLVDYLLRRHFYYNGTIQSNRRLFPPELNSLKMNHKEKKYFMNESHEGSSSDHPEGQKG
ncbi:hypothetical protein RRG08_027571 [Elysia crispata]|uniref:PiggyBac transposable element-derived protein domain-containing protein n=1 Tax=Elysia crispata TaxID=231223 RepID=A0AAE1DYV0_9GAST|nr:hypothetical protein RRG08_027571 [Elysia crispata]